jgi:hypothetical protein
VFRWRWQLGKSRGEPVSGVEMALLHRRIAAGEQAGLMRRRPVTVPASRSGFAGFRFPREVIVLAVRWYLHAPRGASLYPWRSWEELEGRFLGLMAYLDAKARGNSSLPEKQRSCSGV